MPWTKSSDTAATYPALLAVDGNPAADDWSVNEVAGFMWRLFNHSAGHMTDYEVDFGAVKLIGNGRHEHLVTLAVGSGLMRLVRGEGRGRVWQLLADAEFVHILKRDEVLFNRQRDRDRKNPELTMPARLRDGDGCRFCGVVVSWTDRKSGRAGTYDHTVPGEAATVETYVVCCKSCNSSMKKEDRTLLPPPPFPYYSEKSREMLEAYVGPEKVAARLGEPVPDTAHAPAARPGTPAPAEPPPDTAGSPASDPQSAPADTEPQPGARPTTEAHSNADEATTQPRIQSGSRPDHVAALGNEGGTRDGSGRDGSGLVGTGQPGSGRAGSGRDGSQPRRRPRRRSRRGKTPPPPTEDT